MNAEPNAPSHSWIERLAGIMRVQGHEADARLPIRLSCDLHEGRPTLFLPPHMGRLRPRALVWLGRFARRHGLGLIEERRRTDIDTLLERRGREPSTLARGIALMLGQTGMPGGVLALSHPQRLAADGHPIALGRLVGLAAHARPRSKRVVLLPNRLIVASTGEDTRPIVAHACRLAVSRTTTVLSQFDSPVLRCLGYSSGRQYVTHVFLGGGRGARPELWARPHTLTRTDFRLRLFPGSTPRRDFGLLQASFHYDMAEGERAPWWTRERDGLALAS